MGMNVVIEVLIANLNRHRKQPDESQKDALYQAERKLKRDLGDEEYPART